MKMKKRSFISKSNEYFLTILTVFPVIPLRYEIIKRKKKIKRWGIKQTESGG